MVSRFTRYFQEKLNQGDLVPSKCINCKHAGDLDEVCPKYSLIAEDGTRVIRRSEFPLLCKECKDREFDFCTRFRDLICYNDQDPFNCQVDLEKDELYGTGLIEKHMEALRRARLKHPKNNKR